MLRTRLILKFIHTWLAMDLRMSCEWPLQMTWTNLKVLWRGSRSNTVQEIYGSMGIMAHKPPKKFLFDTMFILFCTHILIIPHVTDFARGIIFFTCPSVLFFFVSATPQKPQHRIYWNFVGIKDTMCRCA